MIWRKRVLEAPVSRWPRVARHDQYVRRAIQLQFRRVSPEINALIAATETEDGLTALSDRTVVAPNEDDLLRPLDEAQS